MPENPVCHRCGYVGPVDARYCAHCGHSFDPLSSRLKRGVNRILSNLSPFHIGFLGLILSVPISVFADHLIVTKLSFPLSLVPLAVGIGFGYAYLGWHWNTRLSSRNRIVRMLLVFGSMFFFLVTIWLVDMGLLSLLSDRTHMVVYEVPGVYRESSPGFRHLSIDSDLFYWLVVMIYSALAAIVGYFIHRVRSAVGHKLH
jgi:ribosomal protein L40E